ncbi:MAG: hypothetical protein KIS85_00415 [Anaerolineales bacterium]|nr:hypothetical protein [Anaerolineales bacterium]
MKIRRIALLLILAAALLAPGSALAQSDSETLTLRMSRDFGYSGFDNTIEGLYSLHAAGPENLVRVEFYIDGQLIASVEEPPFRHQFSTSTYQPGARVFSARGFTSDGGQLESNQLTRVLITDEESNQMLFRILGPILGISLVIILGMGLISMRASRKPFDGKYSMLGGAVCPNCQLPFALNLMAPRLLLRRWQRCPHCGKWVVVGRASQPDLAAAEARWRGESAAAASATDPEERKRRQIDDSRYN